MIVLSLFDGMSCGNCALCIHTYMGSECSLTDNAVDDAQDGCIDYIPED